MIDRISLADCLEQYAPPSRTLDLSVIDDAVFVRITVVDQDATSEKHTDVAEISVSLPALADALHLLATDAERERLRPIDSSGRGAEHETRLAGERLTIVPVAPSSAVAAITKHLRYTADPQTKAADKPGVVPGEASPAPIPSTAPTPEGGQP